MNTLPSQRVVWFCGRTNVGIVRIEPFDHDESGEHSYRIAAVDGYDEASDAQFIADYGSTFPKDAGDVLFGRNPS